MLSAFLVIVMYINWMPVISISNFFFIIVGIVSYVHTCMTQAHFLSIVGLRLRAFGAQPPSEQ